MNPETLVVRIQVPDDATDVRARGFDRQGSELVYKIVVRKDFELEVSWRA